MDLGPGQVIFQALYPLPSPTYTDGEAQCSREGGRPDRVPQAPGSLPNHQYLAVSFTTRIHTDSPDLSKVSVVSFQPGVESHRGGRCH